MVTVSPSERLLLYQQMFECILVYTLLAKSLQQLFSEPSENTGGLSLVDRCVEVDFEGKWKFTCDVKLKNDRMIYLVVNV